MIQSAAATGAGTTFAFEPRSSTTSSSSTSSFAGPLASAIEQYLLSEDAPAGLEIGVEAAKGQDPGERQFIVTLRGAEPEAAAEQSRPGQRSPAAARPDPVKVASTEASTPATTASTQKPHLDPAQGPMYSGTVQYVPKPAEQSISEPIETVYDAYWATQPPEVRVLRDIASENERTAKALELTGQGFAIDVPIMVWRWDPLTTMRARETAGYTWVPSAGMDPITTPPGVDYPGSEPYNPVPPAGSIPVSTAWAEGYEHTSPWWRATHENPEPSSGTGNEESAQTAENS